MNRRDAKTQRVEPAQDRSIRVVGGPRARGATGADPQGVRKTTIQTIKIQHRIHARTCWPKVVRCSPNARPRAACAVRYLAACAGRLNIREQTAVAETKKKRASPSSSSLS
eukprot:3437721-Pyramimonas_sp.AAC.1